MPFTSRARALVQLTLITASYACHNERVVESEASYAASAADSGDATAIDPLLSSTEWVSYGHDLFNTRDAPETRISRENVATLQLKWSWTTAAVTSTPTYRAGVLYFADWQGGVVALDAASGQEHWRSFDDNALLRMITASPYVEQDALYIGGNGALWYRLNPANGAIQWTTTASDRGSANTLSSLVHVGHLVIAGVASFQNINPIDDVIGAPDFHGALVALDAASGDKVWSFETTTGRGAGVCTSIAFDPMRKRVFFGTGQNYDDTNSPYADSLIALDYETGSQVWHQQFHDHDSWSLFNMGSGDLDLLASPLLYSAGGVDIVADGDKGGSFRAFERETGRPLWNHQLTTGGHHGGVMGSAATHDGVIYVCSGDFTTDSGDGTGQSGPTSSSLFALDGASGATLWRVPIDGTCYGAVTHANGVVYLPGGKGLRAFDDRDGRLLWSADLGDESAGGVSVVDGMVFVGYGWSWSDLGAPGGVKAFALP